MKARRPPIGSSAVAIVALVLAMPLAEASLRAPGRIHGAIFPIAFAALVSGSLVLIAAILVPALIHAIRGLRLFAWIFVEVAADVALHEMVKWLLLAGAASLGLLQYLDWLPYSVR